MFIVVGGPKVMGGWTLPCPLLHMAKYTEEWIANGNTKFYTRIYSVPNPKAAVVFVHGFIEHIGRCVSPLLPRLTF